MEKVKQNEKLALIMIAILVISTSLVLLNVDTASAQTTNEMLDDDKYGWPVGPGYDGGNTWFNPYSSAPNRPDYIWSTRRPDTGGSLSSTPPVAFDGKIFIHGGGGFFGGGSATLYALDPMTGNMIWSAEMSEGSPRGFGTATMFKVADGYLGYETGSGVVVHKTSNGDIAGYYEEPTGMFGGHGGGSVIYWGGFYNSFDMVKCTTALSNPDVYGGDTPVHLAIGYDLSDPEHPTLKWTWKAPTGIESLCGAPGLCIFGGYGEGEIYALNSTTGELVWKQWKKGNAGYTANYWDGKIYHSASSTAITCYDAETGEVLFHQDEGGRAFFVFGDSVAYGKYIGKNIAVPYGYVGAWDAFTGEPLWKSDALYYIAYLVPCVADGKFFCQRYSGAAGGAEEVDDAFGCWDVETGTLLWELNDISCTAPMVAYGNLYLLAGGTLYCVSDNEDPHPMFHGGDDVENPGIRVGVTGPADISEPTWTYDSGAAITGSAVAGDGKVYFGTLGAEVHCVDSETGEMIWTFPIGYRMSSTPALDDDKLYIGPDDGYIYCLNAETGEEVWKHSAGGKTEVFWVSAWQPRSSPIVVDGRLYVGSLDGNLYCLNAGTGAEVWTAAAGDASRPPGGTPLVVPNLNMVFLSSSNSHLYAFDLDDGTEIWNTEVQPTSSFDDRAMISTPVWDMDDDTLWMTVDTFIIARFNATTGERINHMALPYSRGGTMTPALSTPAIQRVGNDKFLYVGDGFQIDCFYISEIVDDPDLWVDRTTISSAFFGSSSVYARYIDGSEANATTANNVNVNYTLSNPQGNETHLPIVWERWLGHQVYSSPVVSEEIGEWNDKIYFGDDVYAITCINATNGQSLSVYNTGGQVFGTACLYDGFVYMGSQDGTLYAFSERSGKIVEFTISSAANKAGEMWNNETLIIRGRLLPTPCIDEITGFGSYDTNGYANATIKLSVTKPDATDEALEETTDHDGWFEFSYNPTEVGEYGWVVYYDGETKPWIDYLQAYGEWTPISVTSPTTSGGAEPPPAEEGIPMEYVYVAVAVIVIVLVAVGIYVFMRRGK